jgi:hypothetical protein
VPKVKVLGSYADIDAAQWDALVGDASPFLESPFLFGVEALGCAVPETGWTPRPVIVEDDDGTLLGGAPAWVKTHSQGEFVYDHGWANAAQANRIPYYPKLVVGVPFTPVTGRRLLVKPGLDAATLDIVHNGLLAGLQAAAEDCHGLHVLFNHDHEADWLAERGAFTRLQYQFHWKNDGFGSFEDFLAARFPSKKRNKIRRERRDTAHLTITEGTNPTAEQLATMHRFYSWHCRQFGPWGRVYLSEAFFQHLGETWGDRLHLVLASDGDRPVAGTFNVLKDDRLYGRHWGAVDDVKFLHFEVCYYQAIEACIRRGLQVFEPGHGGGHKYRRGFEPTITYSSHWLADPRLHHGLKEHSEREAAMVRAEAKALAERG